MMSPLLASARLLAVATSRAWPSMAAWFRRSRSNAVPTSTPTPRATNSAAPRCRRIRVTDPIARRVQGRCSDSRRIAATEYRTAGFQQDFAPWTSSLHRENGSRHSIHAARTAKWCFSTLGVGRRPQIHQQNGGAEENSLIEKNKRPNWPSQNVTADRIRGPT